MKERKMIGPARREIPQQSKEGASHTLETDGKNYDVYKLIDMAQEILVQQVEVESIKDAVLGDKCWLDGDQAPSSNRVGPQDLYGAVTSVRGDYDAAMAKYPRLAYHIRKVRDADPGYPIILRPDMVVADGMHRVTKAIIMGLKQIPAKIYDALPEEAETQEA